MSGTSLSSKDIRKAEIRRVTVPDQPRQTCSWDLISIEKSWVQRCTPVISGMKEAQIGGQGSFLAWGKSEIVFPKQWDKKSAGDITQALAQGPEFNLQCCQNKQKSKSRGIIWGFLMFVLFCYSCSTKRKKFIMWFCFCYDRLSDIWVDSGGFLRAFNGTIDFSSAIVPSCLCFSFVEPWKNPTSFSW
jgi:hypothetical protein